MAGRENPKRRRSNVVAKTARTRGIFERLREGWSYDDIGLRKRSPPNEFAGSSRRRRKSFDDTAGDHARLKLEWLRPALKLMEETVKRGEMSAVGTIAQGRPL